MTFDLAILDQETVESQLILVSHTAAKNFETLYPNNVNLPFTVWSSGHQKWMLWLAQTSTAKWPQLSASNSRKCSGGVSNSGVPHLEA